MKNHFGYYLVFLFLEALNYVKLLTLVLCSLFVLSQAKMTLPTHHEYHSSIELFYISGNHSSDVSCITPVGMKMNTLFYQCFEELMFFSYMLIY